MSHSWCPSWFSQRKLRGQAPGSALWPPGMRRTLAEDLPQRRLGQSLWPQGVPQKRFEDKGGKTVGQTLFLGSTSFPYAFRILGLRARKSFSILSTSSRSNSSLLVKAVARGCKCPDPVVWFMLNQLFANGSWVMNFGIVCWLRARCVNQIWLRYMVCQNPSEKVTSAKLNPKMWLQHSSHTHITEPHKLCQPCLHRRRHIAKQINCSTALGSSQLIGSCKLRNRLIGLAWQKLIQSKAEKQTHKNTMDRMCA